LPLQDWQSALRCQPLPSKQTRQIENYANGLSRSLKYIIQALDKNDAAAVAAQFTEDAILVPETGPVKGRQAIQKYYEDVFKEVRFSNDLASVDEDSPHIIGTAGNEMWATGAWAATFQGKGWGPMDLKGYWSVIREGDDWNIRMLSFNTSPAPAATPSPTATPSNK
jgi:ketosteroid isomerase-like protein